MRISIRMKLLAGFGLVVVFMTTIGLLAVGQLGRDHVHLDALAGRVVPVTRAVGEISSLLNQYRQDQFHYIAASPAERRSHAPGGISDDLVVDLTAMRARLNSAQSLGEDLPEHHLLDAFRVSFDRYLQLTGDFRRLADTRGRVPAGQAVGDGAGDQEYDHLKAVIVNWDDRILRDANGSASAPYHSYNLGVQLLIGLLLAAVAMSILVAVLLGRQMTRAVRGVGAAAKAIAQGDLGQRVAVRSRDELGDMARDFDLMIDYLAGVSSVAEAIAAGDLSVEVQPRSASDALGNSLAAMTQSLRSSVSEKQRLIDQIPGVVMVFDVHDDDSSRFVFVSRQSEGILGMDPAEFMADAGRFLECVHDEDREPLRAATHEVAAAGREPSPAEFRFIRPDGDEVWLRAEEALVSSGAGGDRIQAVLFDITAAKTAELERQQLELELRLAQKLEAVGQLAAGVAHEINTPVQFIGDSVTFLKEAADELLTLTNVYRDLLHSEEPIDKEERQRRALAAEEVSDLDYLIERVPPAFKRALDGIERVTAIVRAMRDFAHPSTQRTLVDINEALQTTLVVATNEYKYVADIELDLGQLPPVMANAGELNQVFVNVIVNAAHAIESSVGNSGERGTITITTRLADTGVVITVGDTGSGIAPDIASRVFNPFFTTKPVGRGTGQGLAIAHTIIVERHRGTINFTSGASGGTTFSIQLPVDDPAVAADIVQQAA
jgi:PAS domain S-box-containing protein